MRSVAILALTVAVSFSASLPGVFFQPGEWYAGLRKPALTPPGWVFGAVWPALYAMMGVAAWQLWRHGGFSGRNAAAFGLFALQLALNAAWTVLFFGLHRPGLALIELTLLWLAILATLLLFWRRDAAAGALLLPYLAWVSFAAYLNWSFWRLNAA
ncbi:MAG TPA: tryptophan-rich sensory protein [Planctomycetota bacterium]|nr:tryptophan-rich sensory protein [Planctomycetota bacterium]